MFHVPLGVPDGAPVVFGAAVAGREFTRALLRSAQWRCDLFAAGHSVEAARAQLRSYQRQLGGKSTTSIHSMDELLRRFDEFGFSAWHDINADVRRPFELRTVRARRLYPITITHHTFSYANLLLEWFLPLLLQDVQPFDSLVCTSTAARDAIAALLEHVADGFARAHGTELRYRGRLDVIPLGVDTDLFRPRDKKDARLQVGLPAESFVFLWLGRLSAEDKADLLPLLRVFQSLCRAHPKKQPLLVVAGSNVGDSAKIIAEYTTALGIAQSVVVRDKVPDSPHLLHAAADVFVAPTDNIQEAFGLAPLEAMACGVPQVVTDWNGYRDTVAHEETGFRVRTSWYDSDEDLVDGSAVGGWRSDHLALAQSVIVDLDGLRRAMETLLVTPALRQKMSEASRRRAVEKFDWSVVIHHYEDLWTELSAQARRAPAKSTPRSYTRAPYQRAFRGYPTEWLSGSEKVRLTASGRAVKRGEEPLPAYHPNVLDPEVVDEAFRLLGARAQRLDAVVTLLARFRKDPIARARRHLLWLLKYGFAEVVP